MVPRSLTPHEGTVNPIAPVSDRTAPLLESSLNCPEWLPGDSAVVRPTPAPHGKLYLVPSTENSTVAASTCAQVNTLLLASAMTHDACAAGATEQRPPPPPPP